MSLQVNRILTKAEEYKEELTELFIYCYEKVTKNVKPYGYLEQLPKKAKRFVMNRIRQGSPSMYHSVMSHLGRSLQKKMHLEDIETEFKQYMKKADKRHNFTEKEITALKELFKYCYEKRNKGEIDVSRELAFLRKYNLIARDDWEKNHKSNEQESHEQKNGAIETERAAGDWRKHYSIKNNIDTDKEAR